MPARLAAVVAASAVALVAAAPATAATKPKPLDGNALITFKGVGAIQLGMTLKEARKAARRTIVAGPEVTKSCFHDNVLPRRFGLATLRMKTKIRVLYVT